ncbi:MAG: alpha/beta hydrolase-fold protein [Bacteroidota bacterium]
MRPLCLAALLLSPLVASAQGASTLHLRLDLRQPIADGWLDPETEAVGLRGDTWPLSWNLTHPAEDPDGDGIYETSVTFAVPGDSMLVELKIKVDGLGNPNEGWQEGPNRLVVVKADADTHTLLVWDDLPPAPPPVLTGRIDTIEGLSGEGLAPRDVWVWLPPGYEDDPERRYPVLYLHDGAVKFGMQSGSEWGMDETAQALVEAGEIEPLILVAVANTDARTEEYTPTQMRWRSRSDRLTPPAGEGPLAPLTGGFEAMGDTLVIALAEGGEGLVAQPPGLDLWAPLALRDDGSYAFVGADVQIEFPETVEGPVPHVTVVQPSRGGQGDAYGRLLTDVLKPMIDARYRTRPEAEFTGVGGSSLGGLISMHLGLTRPDVFGRLLVASPSVWWDEKWILDAVERAEANPEQRVWIDMGLDEGDSMVPDARALYQTLLARGWDPERVIHVEAENAGHTTPAWAARAPDMLRFLFPPVE